MQRNQRSNFQHPFDHRKAIELQKNVINFCSTNDAKTFDCADHKKLWKILKEMGISDHLPASSEICMQVKKQHTTGHGTMDWFQTGKGVYQGCILLPCLFNLYAEYIMWNAIWMKHQLESRLQGEITITSDMQMTSPLWQKAKRS